MGYSTWGRKESDTTERLTLTSFRSILPPLPAPRAMTLAGKLVLHRLRSCTVLSVSPHP